MSKSKTTKYKITDTNIDKEIIGKQVTVEKIKSKGRQTKKSRAKAPAWFAEFEKRNNQRFDKIEKEVSSLRSDISNLRSDFDRVIEINELER